jgi:predicted AlkP superfamily pyrophosphatase or phosphodiesterase
MAVTTLIMTDGLRPDALAQVSAPRLQHLLARSAYTLAARSVEPSLTLPCHMSIFHSIPPSRHGVMTNQWQPMARPVPGLMEQAKAAGRRCYFFHNWEPLRDLNRPESLYFVYYRDNCYTRDGDLEIAAEAARVIAREQPDYAFVYLGTIDVAGHLYGWMSDGYLRQVEHVDQAIGMVLDALSEDDTVLLQSDHGGHERIHGTTLDDDMLIPWLVAGPGIRRNHPIQQPVNLLDSAPTLARLLQVAPHSDWEGRCVAEIFEAAPAAVSFSGTGSADAGSR